MSKSRSLLSIVTGALLATTGCTPRVMTTVEPAEDRYVITSVANAPMELDGYRALAEKGTEENHALFREHAEQVLKDTAAHFGKGLELVRAPMPTYPAEALINDIEGIVQVEFLVNEEGRVAEARVIRSAGEVLDSECLRVIRLWEFKPFILEGQVRTVLLRQTFPFVLAP